MADRTQITINDFSSGSESSGKSVVSDGSGGVEFTTPSGGGGSSDNIIINGNFDVWQRGTSFAAIADEAFSADRFRYDKDSVAVHTITKSTDTPTITQCEYYSAHSLKLDCTTQDDLVAASDNVSLRYVVEGFDYASLKDQEATLSFWVKATKIGIYCVAFRNNGMDRSYIAEYTINTTNTWEQKEITLTFDQSGGTEAYDKTAGLHINWTILAGGTHQTTKDAWQSGNYLATSNQVNGADSTSNDFYLDSIKLELGSSATTYNLRLISEELVLCHRYYLSLPHVLTSFVAVGFLVTSTTFRAFISTPVEMRDSPTFSATSLSVYIGGATHTIASLTITKCANGTHVHGTVSPSGSAQTIGTIVSGSDNYLEAEL